MRRTTSSTPGFPTPVRLTTNVPLTYVEDERPFLLEEDRHLVLTWGEPLEAGLEETAERFLERTLDYWRRWVKGTRVPRDYQREVVRSALTLKLHQYEDTGALLAATTTSLPEHPGSGRTWDYRFCWLRDAYFTLNAFERLGHSEEMERFLEYLRNIAEEREGVLQPAYRINGAADAEERELEHLAGYNGDGPVRVGNQAFEHVQNDVYGEMVLAVSRLFLDTRFVGEIPQLTGVEIVGSLLDQIESRLEEPDAGLWEFRERSRLHSFSVLMHWAGSRRAVEVAEALGADELAERARSVESAAANLLASRCWSDEIGALTQVAGEPQLDAALLLAVHLGYLPPEDPVRQLTSTRFAPRSRWTEASCAATPHPTTSACLPPRSRYARSGSSRRSPSSAERTRRRSSSTTCSPCTTASASTPRTSSRKRSSRAATSPRRTVTSG